jgi:hypothetical protein
VTSRSTSGGQVADFPAPCQVSESARWIESSRVPHDLLDDIVEGQSQSSWFEQLFSTNSAYQGADEMTESPMVHLVVQVEFEEVSEI